MTKEELLHRIEAQTMVKEEYEKKAKEIPDLYYTTVLDLYTLWRYRQDDYFSINYLTTEVMNELQIEERDLRIELEDKALFLQGYRHTENGTTFDTVKSPESTIENILLCPMALSDVVLKTFWDEFLIIPYAYDTCGIISLKEPNKEALAYLYDKRKHPQDLDIPDSIYKYKCSYIPSSIYKYSYGEVSIVKENLLSENSSENFQNK